MANVPRDPRQLARDILSGKIKIEDLARERQMRAGGAGAAPPAGPKTPERIPLPRTMPPPPSLPAPQPQRPPLMRPPAQPPMGRGPELRRMPGGGGGPMRPAPSAPTRVPPRQQVRVKAAPAVPARRESQMQVPAAQEAAYAPPAAALQAGEVKATPESGKGLKLRHLVRNKRALRQGILMAEILGKPLALREEG